MDSGFIAGDKVRLISGGPEMTIRGPHFDVLANEYKVDMYDCVWFSKTAMAKTMFTTAPFTKTN